MADMRETSDFVRDRAYSDRKYLTSRRTARTEAGAEVNITGNIFFSDVEFDVVRPKATGGSGDPGVNLIATVKYDSGVNVIADEARLVLEFVFDGGVVDSATFTQEADTSGFAPGLGIFPIPEQFWGEDVTLQARLTRIDVEPNRVVDESTVTRTMGFPADYEPGSGDSGSGDGGSGGDGTTTEGGDTATPGGSGPGLGVVAAVTGIAGAVLARAFRD